MKTETARLGTRSPWVVAGVFAATILSSAALADSPSGPSDTPRGTSETRIVKYADLDLTRSADVFELYQRIEDTAKRVCTPLGNVVPDDACLSDALERTVAKIGLPALTSIYVARGHQPAKPHSGAPRVADTATIVPNGDATPVSVRDPDRPTSEGHAIVCSSPARPAGAAAAQVSTGDTRQPGACR